MRYAGQTELRVDSNNKYIYRSVQVLILFVGVTFRSVSPALVESGHPWLVGYTQEARHSGTSRLNIYLSY